MNWPPITLETRVVTIPACVDHAGLHKRTIKLHWVCPVCGEPRGEPTPRLSYDGSRRMHVDGWDNPCGHIDKYSALLKEAGPLPKKRWPFFTFAT